MRECGSTRGNVVIDLRKKGERKYKQKIDYSKSNAVEGLFAVLKDRPGEYAISKKREKIRLEVFLKEWILNRFRVTKAVVVRALCDR